MRASFDLKKIYAKYGKCLKGAKKGEVVTRFPPEPSGYLHIGHVKAVFLNYHYSKIFEGKMILRFDDTNPAKESQEFIDNIYKDLETLEIKPDVVSHTSDHFDVIAELCTKLISEGNAYCDNTPLEEMRKLRWDGLPSACRDTPVEKNLEIWEEMKKGTELGQTYCVRAKISVDSKNKCLRDPTIYRCVNVSHPRTGDKWKVYPLYDFACPIVDTLEGVTHAMRTTEYNDRKDQYFWFIKKLGYKKNKIQEYSRLAFVNTIMSKRYLKKLVEEGAVDGWNDPRFPTVQGIIRRGILLQTLVEFMLDQGPSRNNNLQEWDKIWGMNRKNLEKIAGKYMAVSCDRKSTILVTNVSDEVVSKTLPVHPKNKLLGERNLYYSNKFYIEFDDAETVEEGEKITLKDFMNVKLTKVTPPANESEGYTIEAEALPEDTDFKSTKKITWVIADEKLLAKVNVLEYDHILTKNKIEENEKVEDFINYDSKFSTEAYADACIKNAPEGAYIQFQRRGNFRVDAKRVGEDGEVVTDCVFIPTGKSNEMSNIKAKVTAKKIAKGE